MTTKGVTSFGFKLSEALTADNVATLLDGIDLAKVEVNFESCPKCAVATTKALVEYLTSNGKADEFTGSVKFDPFVRLLKHGVDFGGDIKAMAKELTEIVAPVKNLRVFTVDTVLLSDAGAYIAQELGYALAWGNEWMSQLTDAGVAVDEAAKRIKFNMGITSNYFMEIAKFRAARMLWAQIVKQYQPECDCACKMNVHAATTKFNQTVFDAHVNLLLKEESHLDKITDPAGGSYYVETLTASIADVAWKNFLAIEDLGGFYAAIKEGKIQEELQETSKKRHQDVARRKESLLGTNQFPNFTELAGNKIEKTDGCNCGCKHDAQEGAVASIPTARAASDFEALRLATEKSSVRPKVFMLTIGNLAMRLARAQFSSNFFACAGYEIIDNLGFKTVQEGIDAAMEKNADIVVLFSSDDEYTEYAPEAFKLLDGRAEFVVAGNPACTEDLKAQGIKYFVHVRSSVLETLQEFNAKLLK